MGDKFKGIRRPEPTAIAALCRYLKGNPVVSEIDQVEYCLLVVRRNDKNDLKVFLTDTYILGETDIHEVLAQHNDLDAIINMSVWNRYTGSAKALCKGRGIGLFSFKEFLGAVHYSGKSFVDYEPPIDEERDNKERSRNG